MCWSKKEYFEQEINKLRHLHPKVVQGGAKVITLLENAITFANVNSVLTFVKYTNKNSNGLNK